MNICSLLRNPFDKLYRTSSVSSCTRVPKLAILFLLPSSRQTGERQTKAKAVAPVKVAVTNKSSLPLFLLGVNSKMTPVSHAPFKQGGRTEKFDTLPCLPSSNHVCLLILRYCKLRRYATLRRTGSPPAVVEKLFFISFFGKTSSIETGAAETWQLSKHKYFVAQKSHVAMTRMIGDG